VYALELLDWLAAIPVCERDAALERLWDISAARYSSEPPGEHLIGYHASGVAAIVLALASVPVQPNDVFIDLGAGLGKVVLCARVLTGATARGIELQPSLVAAARAATTRAGADVDWILGDVQDVDLQDGTVFFAYAPFTGRVLANVMERLRAVAERHAIVVCALGIDLPDVPWLRRRAMGAFWLTIYDSAVAGVPVRASALPVLSGECVNAIVNERELTVGAR
jgi:hypothetical protein